MFLGALAIFCGPQGGSLVTRSRNRMLEELERRNYPDRTARGYISAVTGFPRHFGKPPDQLRPDGLRSY